MATPFRTEVIDVVAISESGTVAPLKIPASTQLAVIRLNRLLQVSALSADPTWNVGLYRLAYPEWARQNRARAEELGEAVTVQLDCEHFASCLVIHAFYKLRVNPRHKVPYWQGLDTDTKALVTAWAEMLDALAEVTIHTFDNASEWAHLVGKPSPYRNGREWFLAIVDEMRKEEHDLILSNDMKGKGEWARQQKTLIADIRSDKALNPFDFSENPHRHSLVQVGRFLSAANPQFAKLWKVWLATYSKFIREVDNNAAVKWTFASNDHSKVLTLGRGRSKTTLSPKSSNLKALPGKDFKSKTPNE
jgi:hypothetical protein